MIRVVVNGRFLTRPLTGVDRVAEEILGAWDRALDDEALRARLSIRVHAPPGPLRATSLRHIPTRQVGWLRGHPWEQIDLPRTLRGAWLYNPCNTGPVAVRRSLTTIHDAQVFLHPETYSRAFRLWYRMLLPSLGRRSTVVTTVSAFSQAKLEAFEVAPRGKIQVVPNGVDHVERMVSDPDALERLSLSPSGYFLALGSLSAHKNLAMLIEVARLRNDPDMPIVIAGGGDARVFSQAGFPSASGVRFVGRVDDATLKALYENAAGFLFPSLSEGFGLPPLEAMASGCPVVASDAGAIPEVCGGAALYCDPRDARQWAESLERLKGDPELRGQFRAAGRSRAAAFRWEAAAARLLRLIEDASSERRAT